MTETTAYPSGTSHLSNGPSNGHTCEDPIATDPLHGGTKLTNNLTLPGDGPAIMPPVTQRATRAHRSSTASEMPSFMVSAPGKVIVYGEHAVVYGKVWLHGGMIQGNLMW